MIRWERDGRHAACGVLLLACIASGGCDAQPPAQNSAAQPASSEPAGPAYVGTVTCAGCHAEQATSWRGSHHDLAMQEASAETVLGNFASATLQHRGETFRFETRDGRFLVQTADAAGALRDFEVAFAFGVEPLQQYLVHLPGGRLQALSAAWDARPASSGGQRWFHLQPDEPIPPGDALHWTGLAGSWNAMCAECHSTNLEKGYRPEDQSYKTTWSDLDVGCEACHGPGAEHVSWAEAGAARGSDGRTGLTVELHNRNDWHFDGESPIAVRSPTPRVETELTTCSACHARRSRIARADPSAPFLDSYRPALLEEGLYQADGQILEEVYVWGSFVQSRMYAAGVVCSDCHDPHGLAIDDADAACARCHESEDFAGPSHHFHSADSAGASCVSCHMPARTYMEIDARRDHSLRVPRPDLSERIGVSNACSQCHSGESTAWAAEAFARWYPERSSLPHYGEVLHAGRRTAAGASGQLAQLFADEALPAIVRATALELLGRQLEPESIVAIRAGLGDPDGLVRMAATGAAEAMPLAARQTLLEPRLADPIRAVRIEAARSLAPPGWTPQRTPRNPLDEALAEYYAAQMLNADQPQAWVNLGLLHAQTGAPRAAQEAYERANLVSPWFVPAYVNLADLHRLAFREEEAEQVLRSALVRMPDEPALQHALGLSLVRQGPTEPALLALGRAAELAPENARYVYLYGLALHSSGYTVRALAVLERAHASHPNDADLLLALATIHRDSGDLPTALRHARTLAELRPGDPRASALVRELDVAIQGPAALR